MKVSRMPADEPGKEGIAHGESIVVEAGRERAEAGAFELPTTLWVTPWEIAGGNLGFSATPRP